MRRLLLALLALLAAPLAMGSPLLLPQQGDADVPPTGTLVASIVAFDEERFQFTEGHRERALDVPDVAFDRAVLTFTTRQVNEPWDRRFGFSLDGVEVLRGTTPRTTMTITKDITEYAALLAPGENVTAAVHLGTWIANGAILASARIDLYADDILAPAAHASVVPVARWAYMAGGSVAGADVAFGETAPTKATIHLVTSGHEQEGEFWWMETPPAVASFRVLVDGEEVAHATAMPYVYALVGLGGNSVVNDAVHTGVWWSGFRAADVAGAHVGVGEIPAYRAEVDASQLALLTGARRVELVQDSGAGHWVSSLAVLVE